MSKKDFIGEHFGYIEILEKTNKRKNNYIVYKCKCHKCHNIVEKTLEHLSTRKKQGKNNMTCGCYDRHHNNLYKNGMGDTRLVHIYSNMKARCYNKNNPAYKNYGGRGIKMCDEWLSSSDNFYNWALNNDYNDNLTIERINVDGNYEPSNCKWITKEEQALNKRITAKLTFDNKTERLVELAKKYNIPYCTLYTRIRRGWSVERALNEKIHLNYKGRK